MKTPPLLVTCGLPYTNGPCHLGHLRTYVPADCYVRYMRRTGEEVVFVCGSDNHGTPIVVSAEEQGTTPANSPSGTTSISMRPSNAWKSCSIISA